MKNFQELNLCDDFLFKMVMRDEKLVIEFLEMVLDLRGKIRGIKFIEEEKTIKNRYLDKSVRLDVYVVDEEETVYNIEIQNGRLIHLAKRSRKYQSNMDSRALKPGEDYDNLKKQYIIFVCTGDPFGKGLYKYTFTNRCQEIPNLELGDEAIKVFLNTRGREGDISKELKAFLSFVEESTVQKAEEIKDIYVAKLSEKIEDIKNDEEIGGAFMTLEEKMEELAREKMQEGKAIGIEEGIKEGLKEGLAKGAKENALKNAKAMKEKGFSVEDIIDITNLTEEEIKNL